MILSEQASISDWSLESVWECVESLCKFRTWFRSGVLFSDDEVVIAGVIVGMSISGNEEILAERPSRIGGDIET